MSGHLKLLIFDLDGTLIDSKRDIVLSVNQAFLQRGLAQISEEKIGNEIGRGPEYLFTRLLGVTTPMSTIKELASSFKEIYQEHLLVHTQIYPGVIETLVHYRSIPKVIVTNKNQSSADRVVNALGLREHFESVFGTEAFLTQKPDAGPILEVCKRWNVNPSEAIVIGDSQFDILAGKAAGTRTVAALYGFSPAEVFSSCPPDYEIQTVDQLINILKI